SPPPRWSALQTAVSEHPAGPQRLRAAREGFRSPPKGATWRNCSQSTLVFRAKSNGKARPCARPYHPFDRSVAGSRTEYACNEGEVLSESVRSVTQIYPALRIRAHGGAGHGREAVFFGGNGFRAIGMIAALEEELGRPVLTGNQLAFCYALRQAGVDAPVNGYGQV